MQIDLAWLILDSDIVAELPCPHSGILTYEEDMPTPNYVAAISIDGFDRRIIESYSAQLFLRRHLNQLHNMFYKPESMETRTSALRELIYNRFIIAHTDKQTT